MKKFLATILFAAMTLMILASCGGSIPANTVFSADDLAGKKIGVQLGTVGDLFASDYEADGAVVERYNKGADAVQALKQGKVDAVIIDEQPAKVFVQNNPELKILDNQFDPEEYAIAVAKENTHCLSLSQLEDLYCYKKMHLSIDIHSKSTLLLFYLPVIFFFNCLLSFKE